MVQRLNLKGSYAMSFTIGLGIPETKHKLLVSFQCSLKN